MNNLGNKHLKKVLIITYYWPPTGGSGVQRWVKFAKYLRKYGWEPVIYTPSDPEQPAIDETLLADIPRETEVIKQPIFEPYSFYKRFVGLKKEDKLGSALMSSGDENAFLQKLSVWIRGNFFIPDARKFWIRPSVRFLKNYLKDHQIDALVSTGPPHSMHMIGMKVASATGLPWLADFRDPWTNIDFFEDLMLTPLSRRRHHTLEEKVLRSANSLVVVSNTMKKEFSSLTDTPITVIPNGFDDEDFDPVEYSPNEYCLLTHTGMLTPSRNPEILWLALRELSAESVEFRNSFRLQLIGRVDNAIKEKIKASGIESHVIYHDYMPHSEIIPVQQTSEALLLIINNTPNAPLLLTGKLFEYIAAKRPVVCISPVQGDATEVLGSIPSGKVVLYDEKKKLKDVLLGIFEVWQSGINTYKEANIEQFSRKKLTHSLSETLHSITP